MQDTKTQIEDFKNKFSQKQVLEYNNQIAVLNEKLRSLGEQGKDINKK